MGCSGSVTSLPYDSFSGSREEKIVRNQESSLPFTTKQCRELVNTFRLNSFSGVLTSLQLARALNDLSWTNHLNSKHSSLNSLLKLITIQEKTPVNQLCFLSILLGKGSLETKAAVFFNLIDSEASGKINEKQIFNAVKDLFEISTQTLPKLAVSLGMLTEPEFSYFSYAFKGKQTSVLFSICDQILNKALNIDYKDFLKVTKTLKFFPNFFEPPAIRYCLIQSENLESEENYLKSIENEGCKNIENDEFKEIESPAKPSAVMQDSDSPSLDYTSSDSDEEEIVIKKTKKTVQKLDLKALKPPRPMKGMKNSEPNSPNLRFVEEVKDGVDRERWKNNGETKTLKKVRCSSVSGKESKKVVMKYQLNGRVVEIELRDWEDPIKVAHNFSVKNRLGKRERNSIAVMLSKLQKS